MSLAVAGCVPASVFEKLPGDMGLPAGTPERPTTPYVYPDVHDIPPPRADQPLTEEQQVRLENELNAVRERQEARDGSAKKTEQDPKKKKPEAVKNGEAAGAQDGAKTNP